MGYQLFPPKRGKETQLKEEHPQQEEWDNMDDRGLLARPLNPALKVMIYPEKRRIVPTPRVDHRLIGEDQR